VLGASPSPDHFVDVSGYLDKGIASLAKHRVYLKNLGGSFDPVSFLVSSAERAGNEAGVPLAVTFEVINL
jgi:hypothetical protein